MSKKYSLAKSFGFAFEGIKTAFKKEPNFRIHLAVASVAVLAAFFLKFSYLEWLVLALSIFLVLALELINTTLESLVNLVSPAVHPAAKTAKDVSAAAVFLSALFSVVVGIVLFLPKILDLVK